MAGAKSTPRRPRGVTTFIKRTERQTRRMMVVATLAVVAALTVAGLAIAGVFSGSDSGKPVSKLVKEAEPSTVLVLGQSDRGAVGSGTGWVLDGDRGEIVTNGHVAELGSQLFVAINGRTRPADLVGMNRCEDVALIRVHDTSGLRTMPLAQQKGLAAGDKAIAIGYPGTLSPDDNLVATSGIVSVAQTHSGSYPNVIQTDAAINPGNSGGPLLNDHGQLIGMNTFHALGKENQDFAVGVDRIAELIPELRQGKSTGWSGFNLDFSQYESGEVKPLMTTQDGVDLYGPVISPKQTTHVEGISEPTSNSAQFLVAINGKRFGVNEGDLLPDIDGFCQAAGDITTGQKVKFTILSAEGDNPQIFNAKVPFK